MYYISLKFTICSFSEVPFFTFGLLFKMIIRNARNTQCNKELLAIYSGIVYFRDLVEDRNLTVYTDHKPTTFGLSKFSSNKELPRRSRQLLCIS